MAISWFWLFEPKICISYTFFSVITCVGVHNDCHNYEMPISVLIWIFHSLRKAKEFKQNLRNRSKVKHKNFYLKYFQSNAWYHKTYFNKKQWTAELVWQFLKKNLDVFLSSGGIGTVFSEPVGYIQRSEVIAVQVLLSTKHKQHFKSTAILFLTSSKIRRHIMRWVL